MTRSRVLEAFTAALLDDDPQALYDKAPCGYLTLAPDGTVVKTNDTLRTMLRTDELTGTTWQELLSPAGRVLHETLLMPTLRLRGAVNEVTVDLECPDGTRVPVLLNATAERDQGRVRLVRVAVFDATERRRYERDLVRTAEEARAAQKAAEDAEHRLQSLVDTLQGSLVPRTLPTMPGLSVAGAYRPAGDGSQVGGDFYDVFPTDEDDEWWAVLGDVSGKGVDAAVVTALVRNGARALATSLPVEERTPARVLSRLDVLVDNHETERFCTVALLRVRREAGRLSVSYSSAGHPPLLLRPQGGRPRPVEAQNPPLGLGLRHESGVELDRAEQVELELGSGDSLVLYTDGISEGPSVDGSWGDQGLPEVLDSLADESAPAAEVAEGLVAGVLAREGGRPRDDIACLVLIAD